MRKRSRPRRWLFALAMLTGLIAWLGSLPDPAELRTTTPARSALMEQRVSQARADSRPYKLHHTWVPLRQVSPVLREAVRLAEDASFYAHDGFDFDELEKAMAESWRELRLGRGASTISQQLIKNVYLSPSRNPMRKLSEAFLTYRLERAVDKPRILELYLNLVEWGDGVFGIEAAARRHFGEDAFSLTPAHAVLLAAMLPMPLRVDPRNPSPWLRKRARRLLAQLEASARITAEEHRDAVAALP